MVSIGTRIGPSPRWAGLPWYAPTAIAAVLAVVLLIVLPASGPIVYLAWKPTVDAQTRQRLERDLHLHAPTHTGGTRWGYIVGDTSERNVRKLLALPQVEGRSGLIADPPRAAGKPIIPASRAMNGWTANGPASRQVAPDRSWFV